MILGDIKTMIQKEILGKADKSELPKNLSDLNDDVNLATKEDLSLKVDKETGKGLSTNNFTDDLFFKLKNFFYESNFDSIETMLSALNQHETFNAIYTDEKYDDYMSDSTLENINSLFESPEQIINDYYTYIKFDESPIQFAIIPLEIEYDLFRVYIYVNDGDNSMVLDLTKADIDPSIMPDLSNYIQKSNTSGLIKNDGTIDIKQYLDTNQQNHSNKNVVVNSNGEIDFEDKPVHPNYGYIDDNFNLNLLYLQIEFRYDDNALEDADNLFVSAQDELRNRLEGIYIDFFKQYEDGAEEILIETVVTNENGSASSIYEDDGSQFLIARVSDTIEEKIQIRDDS